MRVSLGSWDEKGGREAAWVGPEKLLVTRSTRTAVARGLGRGSLWSRAVVRGRGRPALAAGTL